LMVLVEWSRAVTERSEGNPGVAGVDGPVERSHGRAGDISGC
jgi:hypothetical protein